MRNLDQIFKQNREWAARVSQEDPAFFDRLAKQQNPKYLWIGCSDSRVPANQVMGLPPGEVFVHRNIANVVVHTDLNCLSVLQYAIEVLHVQHVIVCGHYGCGGVRAAMEPSGQGAVVSWLQHVEDIHSKYGQRLSKLDGHQQFDRLCELNVMEQVMNVTRTSIVQNAWNGLQPLSVHGLIYSLQDGLLRDLNVTCESRKDSTTLFGRDFYEMVER